MNIPEPRSLYGALDSLRYHATMAAKHAVQLEDRYSVASRSRCEDAIRLLRQDLDLVRHYFDYCVNTLADQPAPMQREAAE